MREGARKAFALLGCGLWLASSFCPLFGKIAEYEVRCRGHRFPGSFDACFDDSLPFVEITAPLAALALLYPFARYALSVFAPEAGSRRMRWRLASRHGAGFWHPILSVIGLLGGGWALWRLSLYPIDTVTLPFIGFWAVFASWFALAALCSARAERS